jgi:hypothetical protein
MPVIQKSSLCVFIFSFYEFLFLFQCTFYLFFQAFLFSKHSALWTYRAWYSINDPEYTVFNNRILFRNLSFYKFTHTYDGNVILLIINVNDRKQCFFEAFLKEFLKTFSNTCQLHLSHQNQMLSAPITHFLSPVSYSEKCTWKKKHSVDVHQSIHIYKHIPNKKNTK